MYTDKINKLKLGLGLYPTNTNKSELESGLYPTNTNSPILKFSEDQWLISIIKDTNAAQVAGSLGNRIKDNTRYFILIERIVQGKRHMEKCELSKMEDKFFIHLDLYSCKEGVYSKHWYEDNVISYITTSSDGNQANLNRGSHTYYKTWEIDSAIGNEIIQEIIDDKTKITNGAFALDDYIGRSLAENSFNWAKQKLANKVPDVELLESSDIKEKAYYNAQAYEHSR